MMSHMPDDASPLHVLPARSVDDVELERDDRVTCLLRAMDAAAGRDQWDARDIAVWAEYIRTGTVLDYSDATRDEARGVLLSQLRD